MSESDTWDGRGHHNTKHAPPLTIGAIVNKTIMNWRPANDSTYKQYTASFVQYVYDHFTVKHHHHTYPGVGAIVMGAAYEGGGITLTPLGMYWLSTCLTHISQHVDS